MIVFSLFNQAVRALSVLFRKKNAAEWLIFQAILFDGCTAYLTSVLVRQEVITVVRIKGLPYAVVG